MNKTRVCLVLDDSASIEQYRITKDVHEAFNKTLVDISDNAIKTDDDVKVTLYLFGETIKREFFNVPAQHIRSLAKYTPHQGRTKLFEATGTAIEAMRDLEKQDGSDCAFLIIVVTDGENNDFMYSAQKLKAEIKKAQATDRYTLVFMLPPGSKRGFCSQFGIPEGNVAEWEQSRAGVAKSTQAQSQGLSNYFTSRSAGKMSTRSFYHVSDMTGVSSQDVRKNLVDISRECQVLVVRQKEPIAVFCTRMTGGYIKGAAFYQLVKAEKAVQDYKQVLIMEKGKPAIYAGDHARDLLGLPSHNVKLVPGDHANFDIFVQSTSMNRNVDPGTTLIYYPGAVQ